MKSGFIRQSIKRFFYFKFCVQRAQAYYLFIASTVQQCLTIAIVLKLYGHSPILAVSCFFLLLILGSFIFGHFDISNGFAEMEQTLGNSVNRELKEIHRAISRRGGRSSKTRG